MDIYVKMGVPLMKKTSMAALLLAGMAVTVPALAAPSADGYDADAKYRSPALQEDVRVVNDAVGDYQKAKKIKSRQKKEVQPITLTCDDVQYQNGNGDFSAQGNVKLVQGTETILTTRVVGNLNTGDVWLKDGGTLEEPNNRMDAGWVHYNFNTETGEMKKVAGKNGKDYYYAPHAVMENGRIFIDEGGTSTRCPAKEHPSCLSISAKTITIVPNERIIAKDVKVFLHGKHVYSRDYWVSEFSGSGERILPRIGYKSKKQGAFIKINYENYIGSPKRKNPTQIYTEQAYYSRGGYKPAYGIRHDEHDFYVRFQDSWEFDTDNDVDKWLHKKMDWGFYLKPHRISRKLPLTYNASATHGLWKYETNSYQSWHTELAAYLNHDRIHLFGDKTYLDLTLGRRWVRESYTDEHSSTNLYEATLGHDISPKFSIWETYRREDKTSNLFEYGQPEMAKEWRTGAKWSPDEHNSLIVVNRFDGDKHQVYETSYTWEHRFCCWMLSVSYRDKNFDNSHRWDVKYNFLYW